MISSNMRFTDYFYLMDIHWTSDAALWAAARIGESLIEKYGFEIDGDVWTPERYENIVYKQAFHGNEIEYVYGHNIFEDINVLFPNFETSLEIRTRYYPLYSGDFIDVFMPKVRNAYNERFSDADKGLSERYFTRLINNKASNDLNVLVIGDSFGLSLCTFFSLGFETLDFFYLINGYSNRLVWDIINMNNYDVVIFAISDAVVSLSSNDRFESDRLYLGEPRQR